MVTAAAAVTGVVLTHIVLAIASPALPVPLHLGAWSIALPLIAALALGIVFSFWPAKAAATIPPSEALRND